jgi:hypothetical protein
MSAYYLPKYYSTNTTHDGRYRRIEVKAKAPGLHVRARRGYYAPSNKPTREVFTPAPRALSRRTGHGAGELSTARVADVSARGALTGAQAQVVVRSPRRARCGAVMGSQLS